MLLAVVPCCLLLLGAGERAVEAVADSLHEEIAEEIAHYLGDYLGHAARTAEDVAMLARANLLPHARGEAVIDYLRTRLDGGADVVGYAMATGDLRIIAAGADGTLVVRAADAADAGVTRLHLLNDDGRLGRLLDTSPLPLQERPWFVLGMSRREGTWIPHPRQATGHRRQLTTVHPIIARDGTHRGVALAAVPVSAIAGFLESVDRPGRGVLFVVDRNTGAIIASHDDGRAPPRGGRGEAAGVPGASRDTAASQGEGEATGADAADAAAAAGSAGAADARIRHIAARLDAAVAPGGKRAPARVFDLAIDGVHHHVLVTPFEMGESLDWLVVTAYPRSLFMAPLHRHAGAALLLGLVVILLALAGATLLAGAIGRPLARLSAAARRSVEQDRPLQTESVPLGRCSSREIAELRDVLANTTQRLLHEASHDHLTGLANRTQLIARLETSLARLRADPGHRFTLVFLDLDNFKVINDSLGHLVGDKVLIETARRLRRQSRDGDLAVRLGGDEFVLMLEGLPSDEAAISIAERLREALNEPILLDGLDPITVGVSGGIVHGDAACASGTELLRDADIALYRAKADGKARHVLFDQSMRELVLRRRQLEEALRRALDEDLLEMHYQPIVRLEGGALVGFEALCRWRHSSLGFIPPQEFVTVAEEAGMVASLDRWVLRTVCATLRAWTLELPGARDLRVSVNLSGAGLLHQDLVDYLDELTERYSLRPAQLGIELTESMLVADLAAATEVLGALRERGFHVAIDDFGTGYSSLSYLSTLPVNALKIDKSFVDGLGSGRRYAVVVNAIVALTNELGIDAVAEGIEHQAQYEMLRACGCELAQGYLFSRPISRVQAEAMMREAGAWLRADASG